MSKNKRVHRIWMFSVIVAMGFLLSGCWSSHEINNLAIVSVMGVDLNDTGEVAVTAMLSKPQSVFPQSALSEEDQQNKFLILTATGESVFQAIGKLSSAVPGRIYFGHMNMIIFGERAARESMISSMDFFKRGNALRPNLRVFITEGTAAKILEATPKFNLTFGLELRSLVQSNRFQTTSMVKDLSQLSQQLSSKMMDGFTGVVRLANDQEVAVGGGEQGEENSQKVLSLSGTAVFHGGALKGFLDEQQTRGLLWIRGELNDEVIVLDCGEGEGGGGGGGQKNVSLKVRSSKSTITPHITSGKPKVTVDLKVEADIRQFTCVNDHLDTKKLERMNHQLIDQIHQEADVVLQLVKDEWESDVFGFGEAIYRKFPRQWHDMEPHWRDGELRKMPVELKVSVNISDYGLIKDPFEAGR